MIKVNSKATLLGIAGIFALTTLGYSENNQSTGRTTDPAAYDAPAVPEQTPTADQIGSPDSMSRYDQFGSSVSVSTSTTPSGTDNNRKSNRKNKNKNTEY